MRSEHQEAAGKPEFRRTRLGNRRTSVRIAQGLDDLLMVYSIRAAVYMAEQSCPYNEEFDGNDLCATQFLGFAGDEPAGCGGGPADAGAAVD